MIRQAAAAGYPVSAAQLERWRRSGLLPVPARVFLGRDGSETQYPPGTGELVCVLARHAGPGRAVQDVALLAFFEGAALPDLTVKVALADAYFTSRFGREEQVGDVMATVPGEWSGELGPWYEDAEATARLDVAEGGRAIRQMRINLRRLPDLAHASRHAVDERLLGVLVGLNLPALPQDDLAFMADLHAVLDLDCDHDGDDVLAVWDYAAVSHAAQMAVYRETSPEERLRLLMEADPEDLAELRVQVKTAVDQLWERATWGTQKHAPDPDPSAARSMAAMLVEWMSARLVHPPGANLADRYFIESLAHLQLCCLMAGVVGPGSPSR